MPLDRQSRSLQIPVANLPTGDVVFVSGAIGLKYVEAAEVERLRDALGRLVSAVGDVRVSGVAARTYALHEAWKAAREALDA